MVWLLMLLEWFDVVFFAFFLLSSSLDHFNHTLHLGTEQPMGVFFSTPVWFFMCVRLNNFAVAFHVIGDRHLFYICVFFLLLMIIIFLQFMSNIQQMKYISEILFFLYFHLFFLLWQCALSIQFWQTKSHEWVSYSSVNPDTSTAKQILTIDFLI